MDNPYGGKFGSMKSGKMTAVSSKDNGKGQTPRAGGAANPPAAGGGPPKSNRADWEQFFDANAKARYWFNNKTGEASWVQPF